MASEFPDWLTRALDHLRSAPQEMPPQQWAARIHEALEIVEAKKYATPESRFTFVFSGANDEDILELQSHLSDFENWFVDIKRK